MHQSQHTKFNKQQRNVLITADKKQRCEQRALHLIELLLEPVIDKTWFVQQIQFINRGHYEDITEERSVLKLCGYPICPNQLGDTSKRKYQISTLTNRVYDIADRKKFCSNACFRASGHLQLQVPTSPLWLRDEEPVTKYNLLGEEYNRRGPAGNSVRLAVARPPQDEPVHVTTDEVITDMVDQFDELSEHIHDLGHKPEEFGRPDGRQRSAGVGVTRTARLRSIKDPAATCVASCIQAPRYGSEGDAPSKPAVKTVQFSLESEAPSSPAEVAAKSPVGPNTQSSLPEEAEATAVSVPTRSLKRPASRTERPTEPPVVAVQARLLDWMAVQRPNVPPPESAAGGDADRPGSARHAAGEAGRVGGTSGQSGVTTPEQTAIPTPAGEPQPAQPLSVDPAAASVLSSKEADLRNQRMLGYLHGQTRLPATPTTKAPPAAVEMSPETEPAPQMPLMPSRDVDKVRRRIVNDKLGKAVTRLLPPLGLVWSDVALPLRTLIASFRLTAHNVMMVPHQWTMAALIVLKYLMNQNRELVSIARDADTFFETSLLPYQLTRPQLEQVVGKLWSAARGDVPESRPTDRLEPQQPTAAGQVAPDRQSNGTDFTMK